MGTKVKGLFKGLKYISQIFDEPKKEAVFQIGLPTDVKHVAHIGIDDGPAASDSPVWMKGFESPNTGHHSAQSSAEDSSKRVVHRASKSLRDSSITDSPMREQFDVPKKEKTRSSRLSQNSLGDCPMTDSLNKEKSRSSRRSQNSLGDSPVIASLNKEKSRSSRRSQNSLGDSPVIASLNKEKSRSPRRSSNSIGDSPTTDSPNKEKPRSSRRRHSSKDSSGSIKLIQDENVVFDSPPRDVPDIPKKARKKKSKDSRSSRPSKHRSLGSGNDPESSLKSHSTKEKENSQAG